MEAIQTGTRLHPLVAGAAASVMLVSLLGAAAITGILPSSRGNAPAPQAAQVAAPQLAQAEPVTAPAPVQKPVVREVVKHRTVVHHQYAQQAAAPRPVQRVQTVQTAQAPQPQYHPVGMAAGAVVGGLIGNQVGGGNGKTLATIAGAIGGGYVGNEVAKRY